MWGPVGAEEAIAEVDTRNILESLPKLMNRAEVLAGPTADNLSIVGMTWHDDFAESPPTTISTMTMPMDSFTTKMEGFAAGQAAPANSELSDDDIERAIAEINSAIRKYTK